MISIKLFTGFILMIFLESIASAQGINKEKLDMPGDNLNLYAVMKLFQESETLEGFERSLNAEESTINNLDLNGDNRVDYIKVVDYVDGNDHTIVLQDAVTENENQDVAVFTVQRDANNQVQIQLIGDEELYGKDYIIEPNYADDASSLETPNPGYTGNTKAVRGENVVVTRTTYVEVASWPLITYMFMPSYVAWHSPWYWGYYPAYWHPWTPFYWDYYYGYHSHWNQYYYGHYRPWHYYRYTHWNDHYYTHKRSYSNTVHQHRETGAYRNTYSRPDQRKAGSEAYNRRYSENNNRPSGRTGNIERVNRQGSRKDVNQSPRQGENKPAVRQGTKIPSDRQGVGKPGTRQDVKRSETRPGVNKSETKPTMNRSEPRPRVNKSDTKTGVNKSTRHSGNKSSVIKSENRKQAPRQVSGKQTSGSTKSGNSADKKSKRK